MPSAFGWLDTDNEQRRKMFEVVDLFKDEETVDELGIGSIRDALADAMFPAQREAAYDAQNQPQPAAGSKT